MATENDDPVERESNAETHRTTIRLDQITFDRDEFCHRNEDALKESKLTELMNSLASEGLQNPIEFFRDASGKVVLVKGHRRVAAMRILAGRNQAGFKLGMEVEAIEVKATHIELIIRSVSDNAVRQDFDRTERIRAAKKLHDRGVHISRAARALGMSLKTYERELLIAKYIWMNVLVDEGSVGPTQAIQLLELAEEAEFMDEMREGIEKWVAKKKQDLEEKDRNRRAVDGKGLKPADKLVRKQLKPDLFNHWKDQVKKKERINEEPKFNFAAGIETETEKLHIGEVDLYLGKASVDDIAKVASKLSLVVKQMEPFIKKALEKQSKGKGETVPDAVEIAYDLDWLRQKGFGEVAKKLEAEIQAANKPDGEESPQEQPEERQEDDLTEEVELPSSQDDEDTSDEDTSDEDTSDEDTSDEDTSDEDTSDEEESDEGPGEDDTTPPPTPPPPPPPVAPAAASSPSPSTRKPTSGKGANRK